VLQGLDSARQAAHVAPLGLPITFSGKSTNATSRSDSPPRTAQVSPTPLPSSCPSRAWSASTAVRNIAGGYIWDMCVSKIYRPQPARQLELLIKPKYVYTFTSTGGRIAHAVEEIVLLLGRRRQKLNLQSKPARVLRRLRLPSTYNVTYLLPITRILTGTGRVKKTRSTQGSWRRRIFPILRGYLVVRPCSPSNINLRSASISLFRAGISSLPKDRTPSSMRSSFAS
jgi:hypothetical protein